MPFSPQHASIGLSRSPCHRNSCHCPSWPPCCKSHWTSLPHPYLSQILRNIWLRWLLPSWENVLPWFWGHHTLSLFYLSCHLSVSFMNFFLLGEYTDQLFMQQPFLPTSLWIKRQCYSGHQSDQLKILPFFGVRDWCVIVLQKGNLAFGGSA